MQVFVPPAIHDGLQKITKIHLKLPDEDVETDGGGRKCSFICHFKNAEEVSAGSNPLPLIMVIVFRAAIMVVPLCRRANQPVSAFRDSL